MEYPKSLMFVLAILALGFCFDISVFMDAEESSAKVVIGLFSSAGSLRCGAYSPKKQWGGGLQWHTA